MDTDVKNAADIYYLAAWAHANRQRLISIGVAVAVIGAIIGGYIWHKNSVETAAAEELSAIKPPAPTQEATSPATVDAQPYMKVADEYPHTQAAERALLIAGGLFFDAGKLDQAQTAFRRFLSEYPDSRLANEALLGVAACLEAQGKNQEAANAYDDLIKRHQADSTTPQAKSALARLDIALNKPEQAMRLYEELARANNNDSWSAEAGIQLQELLAKYPNLKKAPVMPAAPAPAPNFK